MNDIRFSLFRFGSRSGGDAVVFAQKAGEEEQEFAADDLVPVHIADVLELRFTSFVLSGIVTDGKDP